MGNKHSINLILNVKGREQKKKKNTWGLSVNSGMEGMGARVFGEKLMKQS